MPRRTPVRELLQKEEPPAVGSPLRRSSRLTTSSPVPTKVASRRNSASEASTSTPKSTSGRRSSFSQELESDEAQTKRRTRRSSLTQEQEDSAPKTRTRGSSVPKEQTPDVKRSTRRRGSIADESEGEVESSKKITRSLKVSDTEAKSASKSKASRASTPVKKSSPREVDDVEEMESIEETKNEDNSPEKESKNLKRKNTELDLSVINEASITEEEETSPSKKTKVEEMNGHVEKISEVEVVEKCPTNLRVLEVKKSVDSEPKSDNGDKLFDTSADSSFNLQLSSSILESTQTDVDASNKENIQPQEQSECEPMDVDDSVFEISSPPIKNKALESPNVSFKTKVNDIERKLQDTEKINDEIANFLREGPPDRKAKDAVVVLEKMDEKETELVFQESGKQDVHITQNLNEEKEKDAVVLEKMDLSVDNEKAESGKHDLNTSQNLEKEKEEEEVVVDNVTEKEKKLETEVAILKSDEKDANVSQNSEKEAAEEVTELKTSQLVEQLEETLELNDEKLSSSISNKIQSDPEITESGKESPEIDVETNSDLPDDVEEEFTSKGEELKLSEIETDANTCPDESISENNISKVVSTDIQSETPNNGNESDRNVILIIEESSNETSKTDSCDMVVQKENEKEIEDNIMNPEDVNTVSLQTLNKDIIQEKETQTKPETTLQVESNVLNVEYGIVSPHIISANINGEKETEIRPETILRSEDSADEETYRSPVKKIGPRISVSDDEVFVSRTGSIKKKSDIFERSIDSKCVPKRYDSSIASVERSDSGEEENHEEEKTNALEDHDEMETSVLSNKRRSSNILSEVVEADSKNTTVEQSDSGEKENHEEEKTNILDDSDRKETSFLSNKKRSSITLQEIVRAGEDSKNALSDRLNKVVDLLYTGIRRKSDVSINVSVEYDDQLSDLENEESADVSFQPSNIKECDMEFQKGFKRRKITHISSEPPAENDQSISAKKQKNRKSSICEAVATKSPIIKTPPTVSFATGSRTTSKKEKKKRVTEDTRKETDTCKKLITLTPYRSKEKSSSEETSKGSSHDEGDVESVSEDSALYKNLISASFNETDNDESWVGGEDSESSSSDDTMVDLTEDEIKLSGTEEETEKSSHLSSDEKETLIEKPKRKTFRLSRYNPSEALTSTGSEGSPQKDKQDIIKTKQKSQKANKKKPKITSFNEVTEVESMVPQTSEYQPTKKRRRLSSTMLDDDSVKNLSVGPIYKKRKEEAKVVKSSCKVIKPSARSLNKIKSSRMKPSTGNNVGWQVTKIKYFRN